MTCSSSGAQPLSQAGTAGVFLCLIILGAVVTLLKRRKRKRSASLEGLIRDGASLRKEFSMTGSPRTHMFTYEELDEATEGFSDARELGVGGFGTVYEGTYPQSNTFCSATIRCFNYWLTDRMSYVLQGLFSTAAWWR
jgi:hypothetical protein